MAVSTVDNGIKVLANADGLRLLRTLENRSIDASRSASETVTKVVTFTKKQLEIVFPACMNQSFLSGAASNKPIDCCCHGSRCRRCNQFWNCCSISYNCNGLF